MRAFSILFLLLGFVQLGLTQTGTVTGKVVDRSGHGFPDAIVYIESNEELKVRTDLDGNYNLIAPVGEQILIFTLENETFKQTLLVQENQTVTAEKVKFNIQYFESVQVTGQVRNENIDELPLIEIHRMPGPQNSVEKYISLTTAATSNNELTNNYNVRGGSYDENLVYVNGFEIYRPFLTRSGQQEGMSFINPNLVESIAFSAGGFTANYGDRLSSVLDIQYRTPSRFRGSFDASFLGVSAHVEDKVNERFNYMVAGRYQDQGYLLNALPIKGTYQPKFYDAQIITNYAIKENLIWSVLGHYSSNDYLFAPQTQETQFGTINQPLKLKIYFQGQEVTRFQTITGATSLKWKVNKRTDLDFYAKVFNTNERETFDILGEYFINQVETDPAKEEYGDSIGTIGIGAYLDHARNQLLATVYSIRHEGKYRFIKLDDSGLEYINNGQLSWGWSAQYEDFHDVMSEWGLIDSAGYSLPQSNTHEIHLNKLIKAENILQTFRTSAHLQYSNEFDFYKRKFPVAIKVKSRDKSGKKVKTIYRDTVDNSRSKLNFSIGFRGGYTPFNNEFYGTPRATISYFPRKYYLNRKNELKKRYVRIHAGTGLYYQPPFYREMRTPTGVVNLNTKSQKSFHFVTGVDYAFEMWKRKSPFKLSSEIFYKYMWDVNPYSIDNVRTMYYAENIAVGHAYGLDLQLNGEFIDGTESFFKLGLLRTVEDLENDDFYIYFNSDGEQIYPGYTYNNTPVDSSLVSPGFIPKPTDQWFTFATLIQDRMPGIEQFTVQLGLQFGSKLPYGPPGLERHKDTLRQRSYFRVDIGFGYDFLYNKPNPNERMKIFRPFKDIQLHFEIFNLLGFNNVLSQQWVQDTEGRYYAVPNYLTQRRFNLKLILRW